MGASIKSVSEDSTSSSPGLPELSANVNLIFNKLKRWPNCVGWNSFRAPTPFDACGHPYLELAWAGGKLSGLPEVLLPGVKAGLLKHTLSSPSLEPAL